LAIPASARMTVIKYGSNAILLQNINMPQH
jgi:hypothetical protein